MKMKLKEDDDDDDDDEKRKWNSGKAGDRISEHYCMMSRVYVC